MMNQSASAGESVTHQCECDDDASNKTKTSKQGTSLDQVLLATWPPFRWLPVFNFTLHQGTHSIAAASALPQI